MRRTLSGEILSNRPSAPDYDNPPTNCYFVRPVLGRAGRPAAMIGRYAAVRLSSSAKCNRAVNSPVPRIQRTTANAKQPTPNTQQTTPNSRHPSSGCRPFSSCTRCERSRVRRSCGHRRNGGSAGARTQDQYLKRVLLYQLSYRPVRRRPAIGIMGGQGTPAASRGAA